VIRIAPVIILTIWKGIIHAMRCVDRDLEPRGNGKAETIADGLELFNQSSVSNVSNSSEQCSYLIYIISIHSSNSKKRRRRKR
jgi:hypothetical protein